MLQLRRPSILFGLASFLGSLPVAWFFHDLAIPGNLFGQHLWVVLPAIAACLSFFFAYILNRLMPPARLGFWRGSLAAFLALIVTAALADPSLVLAALLFVAWFIVPLGGIAGWAIGRLSPNNSFKPNPLRGST